MMRREKLSDREGADVEVLLMERARVADGRVVKHGYIQTSTDSPQTENINGRGCYKLF